MMAPLCKVVQSCSGQPFPRYSFLSRYLLNTASVGGGRTAGGEPPGGAGKMKKFVAGVVVGVVVSWGGGFVGPTGDHNGVFWGKLRNPAKNSYINVYRDAMQGDVG